MKKPLPRRHTSVLPDPDDILPEYDFSRGRRNKYAKYFPPGSQVVVVDPDLTVLFPDARSVNDALRAFAKIKPRQAHIKRGASARSRKASRKT